MKTFQQRVLLIVLLYLQCLRKVAKFVVEQNERVYAPRGLLITDPTERGLRVVSFILCWFHNESVCINSSLIWEQHWKALY